MFSYHQAWPDPWPEVDSWWPQTNWSHLKVIRTFSDLSIWSSFIPITSDIIHINIAKDLSKLHHQTFKTSMSSLTSIFLIKTTTLQQQFVLSIMSSMKSRLSVKLSNSGHCAWLESYSWWPLLTERSSLLYLICFI